MCRKTHLLYNLFLLFMATFILGCATDELFHPTSTVLPDGRILLNLNYDIPQGQEVMTKSMQSAQDQESGVKNAVLLVFESTAEQARESDRLLQWDTVSVVSSVQQQINFIVSPYKGNCRVKVLANLNEEAFAKVSNYVTVSESATTATTLADFKTLTMPVEVLTNTEKKDFLPLYGALPAVIPGLNSQTDLTVTLKRIYARLNIEVAPSITDFIIHNAYVHNILQTGRFEPYEVGEFPMNYPDKFITMKLASTDQKTVGPFYLYENLEYDSYAVVPTEVILEATYLKDGNQERGFYKILIEYSPDNWNYSCEVNRNTRYKAVIKKVKHYGYRTYDEAIRMPSENTALNMDVVIDDLNSTGDILFHSSGYSISATNSDVHVYSASPQATYDATILRFDISDMIGSPNISRSVKMLDGTRGIELLNPADVLNARFGVSFPLRIRVNQPNVTDTIEVRIGGLRKLFAIKSFKMLRSDTPQPILVEDVKQARIESDYSTDWLRIVEEQTQNELNVDQLYDVPKKISIQSVLNNSNTRNASVYCMRGDHSGSLKLIVTQTYGSPYINDLYHRESGKRTVDHKNKRANTLLIPTKQAQTYRLTGLRIEDFYNSSSGIVNPKAEIVWTDFKYTDPNPFEPHDLIEIENPSNTIDDVILRVRNYHINCGNAGNGSIIWGIKNGDGKWLWSWHAWLTDMVEETNNPVTPDIAYAGYSTMSILAGLDRLSPIFMGQNVVSQKCISSYKDGHKRVYLDRNIGAKTSGFRPDMSNMLKTGMNHYGFYYQYGRKDPFPNTQQLYSSSGVKNSMIYNSDYPNGIEYNDVRTSGVSQTLLESIQNPSTFFATNQVSWCDPEFVRTAWISSSTEKTPKTIYDPSPYGWRINWGDGRDLFYAENTTNSFVFYSYKDRSLEGYILVDGEFLFPTPAFRDESSGKITRLDYCFYWAGYAEYNGSTLYGHGSSMSSKSASNNMVQLGQYKIFNVNRGLPLRPIFDN